MCHEVLAVLVAVMVINACNAGGCLPQWRDAVCPLARIFAQRATGSAAAARRENVLYHASVARHLVAGAWAWHLIVSQLAAAFSYCFTRYWSRNRHLQGAGLTLVIMTNTYCGAVNDFNC